MAKFSDLPYFLLKEYMSGFPVISNTTVQQSSSFNGCRLIGRGKGVIATGGAYVDMFIFSNHQVYDIVFTDGSSIRVEDVDGSISNQIIIGGSYIGKTIYNITAYNKGLIPIRLSYSGLSSDDVNIFKYTKAVKRVVTPDVTNTIDISGRIIDGVDTTPIPLGYNGTNLGVSDYYGRYRYEYTLSLTSSNFEDLIDGDGSTQVFFKKDSDFYEWIINTAPLYLKNKYNIDFDLRKYVNTDKDFIYFGNILYIRGTGNNNECIIQFNGFKDFALACLPSNNRTPNLTEFLYDFFDKLYHSNYHMIKDIWSMVDPFECDERWLYYIGKYYGLSGDVIGSVYNKRELLSRTIYLLKRKGTYDAIEYMFKIISNNNKNFINIYDYWYDVDFLVEYKTNYISPYDTDFDHSGIDNDGDLDMNISGAGPNWYTQFMRIIKYNKIDKKFYLYSTESDYTNVPQTPVEEVRKSTRHTIQMDITNDIVDSRELLPKNYIKGFIDTCELLRPVNRILDYEVMISPYTLNINNNNISQYITEITPNIVTQNIISNNSKYIDGRYIFTINHNQNTLYPYIDLYVLKWDNYSIRDNISLTENNAQCSVNIVDMNTIGIIFTESQYQTVFIDPITGFHDESTIFSHPTIQTFVSRDRVDENYTNDSYMTTNCYYSLPVGYVGGDLYCKVGFTNIKTGIRYKLYDNTTFPSMGGTDYGDYGIYNLHYNSFNDNTSIQPYSISVIEVVNEYGQFEGNDTTYNRIQFSIVPSDYINSNSDIMIDEIVIGSVSDGLISFYTKCVGLYVPYNLPITFNYKSFNSITDLNNYKETVHE